MWYRFANQFGEPTPFTPEPSRSMGSNEQEAMADAMHMPALEKRMKELANPRKDPYKQTLEGQLSDLHQESKNRLDPNGEEADALWRGWGVKA